MTETIPKYVPKKQRQSLLYLKQIGAIEYQKTGVAPTEKFKVSFAKLLTMLVMDKGDINKETIMDATVLSVTAMSKLSGEVGISEGMLLETSLVMLAFTEIWFKELKVEIRKLKREILNSQQTKGNK